MYRFRESMLDVYLAHCSFSKEYRNWRDGKLKKVKSLNASAEPESVKIARNLFLQKLDTLFGSKIEPLETKFCENSNAALDELVEFLSVDIPAFRCGYAKEVFLQLLKNSVLTEKQVTNVRKVAIEICTTNNVRREFRRWCRLMIKLADAEFVFSLKELLNSENLYTRLKSKWMIELIRKHRLDLRDLE